MCSNMHMRKNCFPCVEKNAWNTKLVILTLYTRKTDVSTLTGHTPTSTHPVFMPVSKNF
jgi:hypothetical protein